MVKNQLEAVRGVPAHSHGGDGRTLPEAAKEVEV